MNAVALAPDLRSHRLVGRSVHEVAQRASVARGRHADRDRHDLRDAGPRVWHAKTLHPVANALGGSMRGLACRTLQDNHELLTALAIDEIALARGLADGLCNTLERLVARAVAVRLVVGTEVIDVDEG